MRTRGSCRGRDAERPAAGIAPIERAVWRRSGAIAGGVDHVVRAFCERRNSFAVADFLISGEEIGGVEAEAPGVVYADLVEPVGDFLGLQPPGVPSVDVH